VRRVVLWRGATPGGLFTRLSDFRVSPCQRIVGADRRSFMNSPPGHRSNPKGLLGGSGRELVNPAIGSLESSPWAINQLGAVTFRTANRFLKT